MTACREPFIGAAGYIDGAPVWCLRGAGHDGPHAVSLGWTDEGWTVDGPEAQAPDRPAFLPCGVCAALVQYDEDAWRRHSSWHCHTRTVAPQFTVDDLLRQWRTVRETETRAGRPIRHNFRRRGGA